MKPVLLAMLAALVVSGCNDSSQTTGAAGGNSSVAAVPSEPLNNAPRTPKRVVKPVDIATMNKTVEKFYVQEGRFPKDLLELVEKGYLPRLPVLPEKAEWDYDSKSGVVGILKN